MFGPCDFIARITQHTCPPAGRSPDKSFQLVRYYGWYSNKMRGQRFKRADAEPVDSPEPDEPVIAPRLDDPFPGYDNEPVFAQN